MKLNKKVSVMDLQMNTKDYGIRLHEMLKNNQEIISHMLCMMPLVVQLNDRRSTIKINDQR